MYSFYGGRPGNSFVIVTTFRSVDEMITQFKQGPNYTAVHYDEYVMINTINKNNPDNGKLYRRGYNFTNDMGGAEYIGTIVGPSGNAPLLKMTTIEQVQQKRASGDSDWSYSSGEYSSADNNLVPGKTKSGNYNDSITWASYSIIDENHENSVAYIGFTFPYMVIDFDTNSVQPYDSHGDYTGASLITKQEGYEQHPFYDKWNINIPKGVKGDSLKNFRVETASSTVQPYDGQTDDINNNRKILVYDYYNYDSKQDGDPKTFYLGDYNMIEDISMSNDGTITIQYAHDGNVAFSKKLKWINSVNLNTLTGEFTVDYNNGADYSTTLDWIKSVNIEDNGTVTFGHVNNEVTEFQNKIKWCTDVQINPDGTITFKWNNGTKDTVLQNKIQWINAVNLANDGTITVTYNTPDENNPSNPKQQVINTIKWIESIDLDQTGTLTITYNTIDEESTENPKENEKEVFSNVFKSISSVNQAVDENSLVGHKGRLYINYNDGTIDSVALDYLSNITMNQETGEITTEWNNNENLTQQLGVVNFIKDLTIDTSGNLLVKYSNQSGGVTLGEDSGWFSLGKVAPYGNNTNMTVSRILRGKHFIDTDNKTYLQFYVENVGLIRLTDTATISSGTAVFYYNGSQVGNELALANIPIISSASNTIGTNTLNTLNFKIELNSSEYPITPANSSPHLVDIELKDVVINITRSNAADRVADLQDQQIQQQISQNTSNIDNLNSIVTQMNNNISSINNSITNLNNRSEFKTLRILNNSSYFNKTDYYIIGAGGMNVYYNEYFAIIKGRVTTAKILNSSSTPRNILNLQGVIPHKFKINSSQSTVQFTAITEGHSGRDFYIIDGYKIAWKDVTYGWGQGKRTKSDGSIEINWNEVVQIDVIIPFDLSTPKP